MPVWPGFPRGLVRSLYLLGWTTQPAGIRVRPAFFQQQKVIQISQPYLQQQQGSAFIGSPDLDLGMPTVPLDVLKREIAGTWRQRSLRYNHAQDIFDNSELEWPVSR